MKRNMERTAAIARGNVPSKYDLSYSEIMEALKMIRSGPAKEYEAVTILFRYGFVLGHRATVNGKVPKKM